MMTQERWQQLHDKFLAQLNRVREDGEDSEAYFDRVMETLDSIEMSLEVKKLKARLEAVESVLPDAFKVEASMGYLRVLEAVRGA